MEPVTHLLTGACLARTGFHRRVRYATAAMVIAAEFPDIDTLWRIRGPVAAFSHHRGVTHSFLGLPFEAMLLLAGFMLLHLWRESPRSRPRHGADPGPARWLALYGCLVLALLSHLLLDYTNNYGLRPFLPFDGRWYAASLVFIFDPLLFLILLAALVLPWFFGFIGQEIAGGRRAHAHPAWSRTALLLVLAYWGLRWVEHGRAIEIAAAQTLRAPSVAMDSPATSSGGQTLTSALTPGIAEVEPAPSVTRAALSALRTLASPDFLNPFTWYVATDFGPAYRLGTAHTGQGTLESGAVLNKPPLTESIRRAEATPLGQAYLGWSSMPWLSTEPANGQSDMFTPGATVIHFEDLRFIAGNPFLQRGSHPPLTGEVVLDHSGRVLAEGLDGSSERGSRLP